MKKIQKSLVIILITLQILTLINITGFASTTISYGETKVLTLPDGTSINATNVSCTPNIDKLDIWIENDITDLSLMDERLLQIINTELITKLQTVENLYLDDKITKSHQIGGFFIYISNEI